MSAMTEIRDRLQASGDDEAATALDVAMRAAQDRLEVIEDLSRKLEEARGRIGELDEQVIFHKEIADAREFDFHEAEKRITAAGEALAFYGDAETYHAIAFLPDHPCGEFIDDFSDDHGDEHYDRPMPGKRARACIRSLFLADEGKPAELEKTGKYGETKSDQAYQVIGSLASLANCFEHPEVIRALDYFSSDQFDPEFLPFAVFEGKNVG